MPGLSRWHCQEIDAGGAAQTVVLSRPLIIGALVLVIGTIAAAVYWRVADETGASLLRAPWSRAALPATQPTGTEVSSTPDGLSDPSKSLKTVYETNERSLDPAERALAWRAWSVCVPNFLGAPGQALTDRQLEDGLPNDRTRPARLNARRQLADRCAEFTHDGRDQILKTAAANVERHRAGDLRSRGEMALEAVQAGNDDEAIRLIHEIIERQSPYELRDLSGLVTRWHRGAPRASDALRDAVLAVIGCDFGMDCGENSLSALELCAYGGTCDGDLAERTLSAFPDIDRAKLNVLRVETTKAIRDGYFNLLDYFEPPGTQGAP
jgi:hypothetical protein